VLRITNHLTLKTLTLMLLVTITHPLGKYGHNVYFMIVIIMVTQIPSLQQLYNRNKLSHKEALSVYLQGQGQFTSL